MLCFSRDDEAGRVKSGRSFVYFHFRLLYSNSLSLGLVCTGARPISFTRDCGLADHVLCLPALEGTFYKKRAWPYPTKDLTISWDSVREVETLEAHYKASGR